LGVELAPIEIHQDSHGALMRDSSSRGIFFNKADCEPDLLWIRHASMLLFTISERECHGAPLQ
jgi:hypothetical protein